MTDLQKICRQNPEHQFIVTEKDLKFYDQISPVFSGKKYQVPPPTLCPQCRQQRRLAMRNERKLYNRKSDLSGKQIISMYSQDKPYKVYDQDEWWGDTWDAMQYGKDFDFSKTFSEQLAALYLEVPHVSLYTSNGENSYYTNFALNQKNCYLLFGASNDEDCLYGKFVLNDKDCVDTLTLYDSELCYECIASEGCYNCKFAYNSRNCSDSIMIDNCFSCKNCIACFGLKSKEYYFMNEYVGKEKFEELKKKYEYLTPTLINDLRASLKKLQSTLPHLQSRILASENCTGDTIFNSKTCHYAFDIKDCEDCKYVYYTPKSIHSQDATFNSPEGLEFCYNVCSTQGVKTSMATFLVWYSDNIYYSFECHNSSNLFGCVGLKHKKYCIFNKQYTKEEYEILVPKIIEHMQRTGEWGEYFPYAISPYGYNETIAQEYFPLTKEQVLKLGGHWYEDKTEAKYHGEKVMLPEDIGEVNDDICAKVLTCEVTQRHYKIIPQELKFYRKMKLPIPRRCPDQRHLDRLALSNPHKLWARKCAKCQSSIQTSYAPNRPEIIYCEKCYLETIY